MNLNQLVLIVSTYDNEIGTTQFKTGTGYFIASNLVLTANHVLPNAKSFTIRCRIEGSSQWIEGEIKPIWQSDELDAAVLRTDKSLPNVLSDWQDALFENNESWESVGYPSASTETVNNIEYFSTSGLSGILYRGGGGGQSQKRTLDLTVIAPPTPAEKWAGTSGAPVFVKNKLVGLITRIPKNFTERLEGISSNELLKNAGFRAIIDDHLHQLPTTKQWALTLGAEGSDEKMLRTPAEAALVESFPNDFESLYFNIIDVLENPGSLLNFVKILCKAPIVVVDATGFQPGIMLLLGIRAVVRRGVTIVATTLPIAEKDLSKLPFNIQEIKLISLHYKSFQHTVLTSKERLKIAIKEGLEQSKVNLRYLDLPPYDAVRNPVIVNIPAIKDKVLILCPFNQKYNKNFSFIRENLSNFVETNAIVRMLDISSPQLVGQSLYEHIRWARRCIVDWTEWLPNVFYELGVRLASSDTMPISIIEAKHVINAGENTQKVYLQKLFQPNEYHLSKGHFPESIKGDLDFINGVNSELFKKTDLSRIYPGNIFSIAEKYFDWEQENVTISPNKFIRNQLEREFGKDRHEDGAYNVLYSANSRYKIALQDYIRQYWLCAWYYLVNKYPFNCFEKDEELRKELISLGESTVQALDLQIYAPIREQILDIIEKLEDL